MVNKKWSAGSAAVLLVYIMTPNAVPIDKNADLAEAAKIMIRRHVSGLPVIGSLDNANQQPIGITSKSDIVKALTDLA
jgi:CBS domain-containing protein